MEKIFAGVAFVENIQVCVVGIFLQYQKISDSLTWYPFKNLQPTQGPQLCQLFQSLSSVTLTKQSVLLTDLISLNTSTSHQFFNLYII